MIKNSYFSAIKVAMSEGKTDKWAMFHRVHGPKSYSRYYEPHLEDYYLINSRMLRNVVLNNPSQHWYSAMDITDIFLNSSMDLSVAGGIIASRLEIIPALYWNGMNQKKQDIILAFRNFPEAEGAEPSDEELQAFDEILKSLYDWGDTLIGTGRMCRIKTFGK